MRFVSLILLTLLCLLQYRLWLGKHSIPDYWNLKKEVEEQRLQNDRLIQRNSLLKADIKDLKTGLDSVEERARNELGLIREGETFYRILPTQQ